MLVPKDTVSKSARTAFEMLIELQSFPGSMELVSTDPISKIDWDYH
jgi:hypothetical protein